jgi:anti-sigma B factor antagonist
MGDAVVNRSVQPDGTVVIELRGELDLAINDALRLLLVETATTVRPPRIEVDMRYVSFVDSTGIGALAAGYSAARAAGVEFTVRDLAPFIAEQLRLTGLYEHLVKETATDA